MEIYRLQVTSKLENSSSEGVYGYYSSLKKAEKAYQILCDEFHLEENNEEDEKTKEAFEIEEFELNLKPKLQ